MLSSIDSAMAFRAWLRRNHRSERSLVVRIARKHAAGSGISYGEALDEALCFGWIDGVRRRLDADSFSIRFSPRTPRSIWSLVNVAHVERLIASKRMTTAGLAAFEARHADRTGIYSFERAAAELPEAFTRLFRRNRAAWRYFQDAAPSYRRTATHWVVSAKQEATRLRRLETLIACSAEGVRIPPLRRS